MAKERGWWELKTTTEPNEVDLEHIADLIKQGCTSGEICENEEEEQTCELCQETTDTLDTCDKCGKKICLSCANWFEDENKTLCRDCGLKFYRNKPMKVFFDEHWDNINLIKGLTVPLPMHQELTYQEIEEMLKIGAFVFVHEEFWEDIADEITKIALENIEAKR